MTTSLRDQNPPKAETAATKLAATKINRIVVNGEGLTVRCRGVTGGGSSDPERSHIMWSQTLNFGGSGGVTGAATQRSTTADELFSSASREDDAWNVSPAPPASELFDEVPLDGSRRPEQQQQQPPEVAADVLFDSPEVSQTMDAATLFGADGPEDAPMFGGGGEISSEAPLFGGGGNVDDAGGEDGPEEAGVPFFDDTRPEDSFSWRGRPVNEEPEAKHETESPEQTRNSDDNDKRFPPQVAASPLRSEESDVVSCVATSGAIATGICFLDHMLDQLKSHGQLQVGAVVSIRGVECQHGVEYAPTRSRRPHDTSIFAAVGKAVGSAVRDSLGVASTDRTTFVAPLDEALVRVSVKLTEEEESSSCRCELAPYGETPRGGRLWIGRYRTSLTPTFFKALAQGLRAEIDVVKLRGKNAHHVVEAAFKSFARALRENVDLATDSATWSSSSGGESIRGASRSRQTKETKIDVRVDLSSDDDLASALEGSPTPTAATIALDTGVSCYDALLRTLAEAAGMSLSISCVGDTYIDDHHTVEDVAITLGQCVDEALGSRSGCNRMATASCDDVEVVVDLSNRPHLEWHLPFYSEFMGDEEEMASEMIEHVFQSLATSARLTLHVYRNLPRQSENGRHRRPDIAVATSAAKAFGLALRRAMVLDPRRCGKVASSKGTLDK